MAQRINLELYDSTQPEIAEAIGTSQQNVNEIEKKAIMKAAQEYLKYYTLDEIFSYLRHCERR